MQETKIATKIEEETKGIKKMCEQLHDSIKHEFNKGIEQIDTEEMKEAIDMLKDLYAMKKDIVEACYYKQIMEAMEESDYGEDYDEDGPIKEKKYYRGQPRSKTTGRYIRRRGYEEPMYYDGMYPVEYRRDMDRESMGKMYYSGGSNSGNASKNEISRDGREGRSGQSRRSYMETKEMHKDNSPESKQMKMRELEKYMKELSEDVTEMISDASPEEKSMLKTKMQTLIQKI